MIGVYQFPHHASPAAIAAGVITTRDYKLINKISRLPVCKPVVRKVDKTLSVERVTPVYDWIIEADIYRLTKAIRDLPNNEERQMLMSLRDHKQAQLKRYSAQDMPPAWQSR